MLVRGGSATWFDGKHRRVLDNSRAVQPIVRLPWPLSIFQPSSIALEFYAGENFPIYDGKNRADVTPVYHRTFKIFQAEQAIDAFLQGATPTDQVQF
jgi:hypothetical protein